MKSIWTTNFLLAIFIWACITDWLIVIIWGGLMLTYLIISCIIGCYHKNGFRRKLQIATWNEGGDPSIFTRLEIDMTNIDAFLDNYNEANSENKMSYTVIFAKAIGLALASTKKSCGKISFGQFIPAKSVDISVLVDIQGENLANFVLKGCEEASLRDLMVQSKEQIKMLKTHKNQDFNLQVKMFGLIPTFILQKIIELSSACVYNLGIPLPCLKIKKDNFGYAILTNVSGFNVHDSFGPLVPFMKTVVTAMMNTPVLKPVVVNNKIEIRKIMNFNITTDHRFIDGSDSVKIFAKFFEVVSNPASYL